MASPIITIGSACTGVGMLDEAVRLGCAHLDWRTVPAFVCEWESYAAATLLARMEEASVDPCPIFCGDLADLDGRQWRGKLDCFVAGFPCQPWSQAGKQEGTADERWLWPELARIIRDAQPSLVFLENVPGLVSGGGLHHVLDGLAEMRFDAEWCHCTAEAVGASHKRERVFILAYRQGSFGRSGPDRWWRKSRRGESKNCSEPVAVPARRGQRKLRQSPGRNGQPDGSNEVLGHSKGSGLGVCEGEPGCEGPGIYSPVRTIGELGHASEPRLPLPECDQLPGSQRIFAPGPKADWGRIPEMLYPATEPGLRVLVDGLAVVVDAARADQLRCGGNGVVAIQGAVAFVELMRRVMAR